ncbi:2-amino-4-hydroxy-6-hydroxymethyldihydropteridine diphosphokinase [Candidatus Sumerlaeota bacterium]|nr:2-amino-4-hydroxy-6-hydroxymethyldihydropteridine diphosphokinase [Candidatus Sumerlaeota bacterium]
MERIILSLGSNLGCRRAALDCACGLIGRRGVRIVRQSSLYWTRPLTLPGGGAQPEYLNAAVEVRAAMHPLELLHHCRAVEREMGRVRRTKWEARRIDIDLIFFGGLKLDHPDLTLPHPQWRERDFVLAPLIDLDMIPPGWPAARSRGMLLESLARAERHIRVSFPWSR